MMPRAMESEPVNDSAPDANAPTEESRQQGDPSSASGQTPPPAPLSPATAWWQGPLGQRVHSREQAFFDAQLPNLFGFYALQIGLAGGSVLGASRIQTRWVLDDLAGVDIEAERDRLPFPDNQFDVIALPHTLESDPLPHEVLREAYRVLRPEGQLLLTGFNPLSMFGLRRLFDRANAPPWNQEFISLARAKDWLTLLGFDLALVSLDCFGLPAANAATLERFQRVERWGETYWPFAGGIYCIRAVKRVAGMRLIRPAWARPRSRSAAAAAPTRGSTRGAARR